MLLGIAEHRRTVARIVRQERAAYDQPIIAGVVDIDVSINGGGFADAEGADSAEHRRLACEAKAELWKHIGSGDVDNAEPGESVQVFEEWSHTE